MPDKKPTPPTYEQMALLDKWAEPSNASEGIGVQIHEALSAVLADYRYALKDRESPRYEIVSDNSGHEYYIPVDRYNDWANFMEIDEDDDRSWRVPYFAIRIDGRFTFTDPRCD